MKKSNYRSFIIPLIIYPFDVIVSFGQTDKEVLKLLRRYKVEIKDMPYITEEKGGALTVLYESKHILIRMPEYPVDPYDIGMLQHEIFHAVSFALRRIGMLLSIESDESYAYLIGYLTTEIFKKLNEKDKFISAGVNN